MGVFSGLHLQLRLLPQHPLRRSAPTEAPPFPSSAAASTSSPSTSPPSTSPLSEPALEPTAILAAPPAASGANLTALLEKAGCKTSDSLSTFAPNDEASKDVDSPDLCKLSNAEVVSFLQYQALATYTPVESLKQTEGRITTLATNGAGKYDLGVKTAGDSITLDTGADSSRIASTVLESNPLSGKALSPAPGPALEVTPPPNFHF